MQARNSRNRQAAAQLAQGEASRAARPERQGGAAARARRASVRRRLCASASMPDGSTCGRSAWPAHVVGDQHEGRAAVALKANSRSMICSPVVSSRLPVGSSATRTWPDSAQARGRSRRAAARRPKLRRVVAEPAPRPTAASSAAARSKGVGRRRARAAGRRSRAPSWSARGGSSGTRCRCAGREARQRILVERPEIGAVDDDRPESGRSRPARSSSAASICPSPTARRARPPRHARWSAICLSGYGPARRRDRG